MARTRRKRDGPYKSRLEDKIAAVLKHAKQEVKYEKDKLKYTVEHTYNPDFTLGPSTFIEGKGLFKAADRAKHLYIKEQHPEVRIFFVFGNPCNKLSRVSKTTYAEWADKHGYQWCSIEDFNKSKVKQWLSEVEE